MDRADDSRRADQRVYAAEHLAGVLDSPARGLVVSEVGLDESHAGGGRSARPVNPDHVRFEAFQHGRELAAETTGGTGDHYSAACGWHSRPFRTEPSHS
jgi:hypothetical protein